MCSVKIIFFLQISSLYFIGAVSHSVYVNSTSTRFSRQTHKNGCFLPNHPRFGQYSIYQSTSKPTPGTFAPLGTVLQVSCGNNYKLEGDAAIVCVEGEWSTQIGQCLRTCSSIYSTPVMRVTCIDKFGRKKENCTDPVDDTKARFKCSDFYEDQSLDRHPVHLCYNGKWSHRTPECVPICGQKSTSKSPTLIVGGPNATQGEYPWQVALFNVTDKDLLCGGSLINQRIVLTAAHCVTDKLGKLRSKELYIVGVGKYYRRFDHPEDNEAQFSPIYEMYIPKQYKGDIQNYFGDLAILVTKKTFFLSTRVQPVCVDWAFNHPSLLDPVKTKHGYVAGWGFTVEYENPSSVLKELKVPLLTNEECEQKLAEDYTKFVTDDKLCAGYLDKGLSVCRGDSGGGLVTKYGNRFYIVAVVSLSPQAPTTEGGCDSHQYALYTRISYYTDSFILAKEARFRPSSFGDVDCDDDPNCKSATSTEATIIPTPTTTTVRPVTPGTPIPRGNCVLPPHPLSGQWIIFGSAPLSPGALAVPGTILQVSCKKDHTLVGPDIILCDDGKWNAEIGQCLRTCPSLHSTPTTQITCSFNDKETKNCNNPVAGTVAKHQCAPFYEDLQLAKNPVRVCRNGSWDLAKPDCIPACGRKSVTVQTLIINGKAAKKSDYPWHVGIYRGRDKKFICSGALISQKLILTAAHCVSDQNGKVTSKNDYTVAVGKYYRDFYDPLDSESQSSKLQDIFIPVEYTGVKSNFLGDIAVLVTRKTFTLSGRVQPVCVDWSTEYENLLRSNENLTNYISGWGYTVSGNRPADELQELQVPIVTKEECYSTLPEEFRNFLSSDKICAGYVNRNTSACNGDAGGALVTKRDGRYYITGIISVAPSIEGRCNIQTYTLYTKVAKYSNFILGKEAQFRPSSVSDGDCNGDSCGTTTAKPPPKPEETKISCTLPEHPRFGKWSIYGVTEYIPGNSVVLGTVLRINCNDKYKLDGDSVILCENGKWTSTVGKCLRICPPISSTSTVKATCIVNGKEIQNCNEPTDGTRVKYECASFYEDRQLAQNPIHLCQDGSWDHPRPRCVPVCGQKSVTPQILIVNGNTAKKGEYPWNVAIYRNSQELLCGGTLINQRLILTGAECVTDSAGKLLSKDLFTVAVGKYYRKFNDARDRPSDIQFSQLHDMVLHPFYGGPDQLYIANIAILVTTKPFTLSLRVQPICVDWGLKYQAEISNPGNLTGYVTGWGFTQLNSDPADALQELDLPIVSNDKCKQELPPDFTRYLTPDKLCAGYRNGGKSVCKGDSGGGLAVKFNGRFYIVGIVAIAPSSPQAAGGCDNEQYALFSKISPYIDFILQKSIEFQS